MNRLTMAAVPEFMMKSHVLQDLPSLIRQRGMESVGVITGGRSALSYKAALISQFENLGIQALVAEVRIEPTVDLIDQITRAFKDRVQGIVAIGGGSVIDTGKAVSAMAVEEGSVAEYLEGVGHQTLKGKRLPFIAVPTTAGTGAEATFNSVVKQKERGGYKKSLRHKCIVPDLALLDPCLAVSAPFQVTLSAGLDCLTQLIEAYVSSGAGPLTDGYCVAGLRGFKDLFDRVLTKSEDLEARGGMAVAAFCSGVALANAGLGVVHGLAGPAGGVTGEPHGVLCGQLLAPATERIVKGLTCSPGANHSRSRENPAYKRYVQAARLILGYKQDRMDDSEAISELLSVIRHWASQLEGGLIHVDRETLKEIAMSGGAKNTPVELSRDDFMAILKAVRD